MRPHGGRARRSGLHESLRCRSGPVFPPRIRRRHRLSGAGHPGQPEFCPGLFRTRLHPDRMRPCRAMRFPISIAPSNSVRAIRTWPRSTRYGRWRISRWGSWTWPRIFARKATRYSERQSLAVRNSGFIARSDWTAPRRPGARLTVCWNDIPAIRSEPPDPISSSVATAV